ncbi:MAG: endo alpha-1,4 polygalactosaminidase [Hydrogenibacillus schlegelii]|uniref:Endo alpha-1,4 polygalactosaminidase n=1 Tax=Hydrogenibacillus schlegelii TaxID=1484 RepID=A0A947CVA4_HYDSH|nr:endo alpha-1,4 polygalactosaminidase [Hydrogenibacillus schlegelii]
MGSIVLIASFSAIFILTAGPGIQPAGLNHGLDPDNLNGYQNDTGFPLSAEDQLRFNRWVAYEAHRRGLIIGLKNDPEQAEALALDFDWILVESCVLEGWCPLTRPFRDAGKPVLALEDAELGATPEDAGGGVR